jgi:hypothetical protein
MQQLLSVKVLQERLWWQDSNPSSYQFDGQWQPIEAGAQLGNRSSVLSGEAKAGPDGLGSLDE